MQNGGLSRVISHEIPNDEESDQRTGNKLSDRRKHIQQRGDTAGRRGQQKKSNDRVATPIPVGERLVVPNEPRHIQKPLPDIVSCLIGCHIVRLS